MEKGPGMKVELERRYMGETQQLREPGLSRPPRGNEDECGLALLWPSWEPLTEWEAAQGREATAPGKGGVPNAVAHPVPANPVGGAYTVCKAGCGGSPHGVDVSNTSPAEVTGIVCPWPTGKRGEAEGLTALADGGNAPAFGCTSPDTTVADAWDCILLAANSEPDRVLGSEVAQTGARMSLSGIAEAETVTMVLVGKAEGGNVRGAGRACTGAETRDRERKDWGREDKERVMLGDKGERETLTVGDKTTRLKRPLLPNLRRYASPLEEGMRKQQNGSNEAGDVSKKAKKLSYPMQMRQGRWLPKKRGGYCACADIDCRLPIRTAATCSASFLFCTTQE